MDVGIAKKKNIIPMIISSILLLVILSIISGSLYYYFAIYRNRDLFRTVQNNVDVAVYEKSGFKKIEINNTASSGKYSFFVPAEWVLIDNDLQVYGDVLSGSNSYMNAYANALGVLTSALCRNFASELDVRFKANPIYSKAEQVDIGVSKAGDYDACVINYLAEINSQSYKIRQVYFFRKNRIYQLFIQISENLVGKDQIMKLITDSVQITD